MAAKCKPSRRCVTRFTRDGVELRVPVNALTVGISRKAVPYSRAMAMKGLNPDPESKDWRQIGSMSHGKVRITVKDNDGRDINISADDLCELLWGDEPEPQPTQQAALPLCDDPPPPEPELPEPSPPVPALGHSLLISRITKTRRSYPTLEAAEAARRGYELSYPRQVHIISEVKTDVFADAMRRALILGE